MQRRIHWGCLRKVLSFKIVTDFLKEIIKRLYVDHLFVFDYVKLDVIGTLVMMILVDLMLIAKREMMLPYAHAHQVDTMPKYENLA